MRRERASLIGVSAGSIQIDAMARNFSAYNSSKFAEVKMLEILAAANPGLYVVTMHPGVGVYTFSPPPSDVTLS